MEIMLKNDRLAVTVSSRGAELRSIQMDGREFLWQGDARYWEDRAPVLFPFVARLWGGRYSLDGRVYELPIHGFASAREFERAGSASDRAALELHSDDETLKIFPREFLFRAEYALEGQTVKICWSVTNPGGRELIFGLGGHPGFRVPGRFESYYLEFGQECEPTRVGFTEDCFLNGEDVKFPLTGGRRLPLRHEMFDQDAIVLRDVCREVTLASDEDPRRVTVRFPQMGYLGIWHRPGTEAPYVCIEPWCSLPGRSGELTVFEEREDLIHLRPGETVRNEWSIEIQ